MTEQRTAPLLHVTERQKARARLALLTIVGIVCPPLAGVRSGVVWGIFAALAVLYSLWSLRLTRYFADDRRLGYLLCLTDGAVVMPLLVWSSASGMRAGLALLWVAGLLATCLADRTRAKTVAGSRGSRGESKLRPPYHGAVRNRAQGEGSEAPLERALKVRLRVLASDNTRFAVVVLRVVRFEEISSYYGQEAAERLLTAVSRRGLRLLGPDAQQFTLQDGRVAFVFATDTAVGGASSAEQESLGWIDPYDVESLAMALGRRACEHLVDGHRVECVVGWASAPADGMSADDLMYAAESGAQSTAAFRRVAGSRVPVPEKTRVVAG